MTSGTDTPENEEYELTKEQVEQFYEEGYLGPLKACSPEEAREFREQAWNTLETENYPLQDADVSPRHDRHRDSRLVYDFVTQPGIVEKISDIYGPDLLLWTSHLWEKGPGEEGVPWHQEQHFSAIEPPITATLDLALDPYDEKSGCFQVIPGSHEGFIPHTGADGAESQGYADRDYFDESEAVSVELEPGEFLVYNSRLLHQTLDNDTDRSRRTVSCRMTTPLVNILTDSPIMYDDHEAIVVKGEDWHGLNATTTPPEE